MIIQKDNTIKYKDISTQIKTTKFLEDKDSKGKVRDWKGKKKRSLLMADHYGEAKGLEKTIERMYVCGGVLSFNVREGRL